MKRILALSFFALCFYVSVYSQESKPSPTPSSGSGVGRGSGIGSGSGGTSQPTTSKSDVKIEPLRIISKPRAKYTDIARENDVEGAVRLRVTFLKIGEIGAVSPVTGLPYGLTEMAIAAAKQIRFTPQKADGNPITVTKLVEYSFSVYYDENDERLKSRAEIVEMPTPENPSGENFKSLAGKVRVMLALTKGGEAKILQTESDLPQEFKQKAAEAAAKIKFKPAVHQNGKEVSQTKEIEYEFKAQSN